MTINVTAVASALRYLADALEDKVNAPAEAPPVAAEPARRGRPPKAKPEEAPPVAAPAAPPPPPPAPEPRNTHDQVRTALTALRKATSQDKAVEVLKTFHSGPFNDLPKDKFDAVVAACIAAMPTPPAPAEDPFGLPAAAAPTYSLEDVKKACVDAQKRSGADRAKGVVMAHGGVAVKEGGQQDVSLKALDPAQYGAVIAALAALPTTK